MTPYPFYLLSFIPDKPVLLSRELDYINEGGVWFYGNLIWLPYLYQSGIVLPNGERGKHVVEMVKGHLSEVIICN